MSSRNSRVRSLSSSRRAYLLGVGGAATTAIAGCLGGGGDDDAITVLTSASSPDEQEVWEALSDSFEEETGHTVEWEFAGFDERFERLSAMIRGGEAPEIALGNSANAGRILEEDLLEPITDLVEEIEEETGSEIPQDLMMREDGEVKYVPNAIYLQNQNIRGDLVEEVGHEFKQQDITYDEHLEWVEDIDEQTDTRGFAHANAATNAGAQATNQYLWANGVEIFGGPSDDIQIVIDEGQNKERAVETLEHLQAGAETGPGGSGWSWGEMSESFISATAASVNYPYGRVLGGALDAEASWAPDHVNFAEPPHGGRDPEERRVLAALFGWTIINEGANIEPAKEFLKFFFTSDYYIDFLHTVPLHYSPALDHVWDDEYYRDNEVIDMKSEVLDLQRELSSQAEVPAFTADGGEFNPVATTAYGEGTLGRMAAEVVHEDVDPETAVDNAAENLRNLK